MSLTCLCCLSSHLQEVKHKHLELEELWVPDRTEQINKNEELRDYTSMTFNLGETPLDKFSCPS